jgi:hypothetical protein
VSDQSLVVVFPDLVLRGDVELTNVCKHLLATFLGLPDIFDGGKFVVDASLGGQVVDLLFQLLQVLFLERHCLAVGFVQLSEHVDVLGALFSAFLDVAHPFEEAVDVLLCQRFEVVQPSRRRKEPFALVHQVFFHIFEGFFYQADVCSRSAGSDKLGQLALLFELVKTFPNFV